MLTILTLPFGYGPPDALLIAAAEIVAMALLAGGSLWLIDRIRTFAIRTSMRAVLSHAPAALAYFDRGGGLVFWSEDYARVLQAYGLIAKRDLPFKTIVDVCSAGSPHPPELPEDISLADMEAVGLLNVTTSDGRSYQVRTQTTGGGGFVLVMADITKTLELIRREAEARQRAEEANHAKSEFLANMSHEIRTPLNGILGMAQVMARDPLPAAQRDRLKVIGDSGQDLLMILNGVLDLSKIEADRMNLDIRSFDLTGLAGRVAGAFQFMTAQKGLALRVDIDPGVRGDWRGDEVRIGQVLTNLVSNALKFTERGAITLWVRSVPDGVTFEVNDTGIGIAHDKLDLIFDAFTQADASTTRRYGGTGLGLTICRRFVRLMGGDLRVVSKEGAGSTFSFTLPLERASRVSLEAAA